MATGTTSDTWWIERECPRQGAHGEASDMPCEIANIDNYGTPTDVLLCLPHGEVVGHIVPAPGGDDVVTEGGGS